MLTFYEWMQVEEFFSGTFDGHVPHLTFNAWRVAYSMFESSLLPQEAYS